MRKGVDTTHQEIRVTSGGDERLGEPRKRTERGGDNAGNRPRKPRGDDEGVPDPIDEADEESFPASDPPAYVPLHPGPPKK